jgi:hypothetical protein
MAKTGSKVAKKVQKRGITGLAWASAVVALVGGTLAVGTWMGDVLRFFLGLPPWDWFPPVLLVAAVIGIGVDIFIDLEPNQVAIAGFLLGPTIASATPGKLGAKITEGMKALLDWIDQPLAEWVGTDSSTGLAIACIVAAILMAKRVVRKTAGKAAV